MKTKKTLHIAYACDSRYAGQTMVSMISLFAHHTKHKIVLHLVEDRLSRRDLWRMARLADRYGAKLEVCPLEELIRELPRSLSAEGDGRHPMTIYAKLFLEKICRAERVLYLDSDTVVSGSLLPLWDLEPGGACAAGVRMPYPSKRKARSGTEDASCHVCDGVLLLYLDNWRLMGCGEQCADDIRRRHGTVPIQSEEVINRVLKGRIQVLPPAYNLMSSMILWNARQMARLFGVADYYSDREIYEARKHPVIVHYLDELYIRPWYPCSDHPYRALYRTYARRAGVNVIQARLVPGRRLARTRAVRLLHACLPFPIFCRIYRMVKNGAR